MWLHRRRSRINYTIIHIIIGDDTMDLYTIEGLMKETVRELIQINKNLENLNKILNK